MKDTLDMSTTYFSWTYPLDSSAIESGAHNVLAALQHPTAQDDLVRDESRGDWYLSTVEKMVRNYAPEALRFLDRSWAERVVDSSEQPWTVATLPVAALPAALAALERLLHVARTEPARMLPYFDDLGYAEADIREASLCPREVDGDEGLGPGFLFAHLEELCGLLKRAMDAGFGIAHIRYLYE